ncbi:HD-GYP domain-containing protein [Herbaspirillum autotrophicum]|uniref:HD-GYP domain-containing protein n=1 Tax=Herbaspirillum autotrophicum TaxID=180195 RepID=UPI000A6F7B23|nr:HD domain-containing phosphohydrolase [Herbaspirillum autotrophicum]
MKNYSTSLRTRRDGTDARSKSISRQNTVILNMDIQTPRREKPSIPAPSKMKKNRLAMDLESFSPWEIPSGISQFSSEAARNAELDMMHRLTLAASFKDSDTGMHLERMSHYARVIAAAMDTSLEFQYALFHAAPMHDIGKLGIPDHILLKRGRLTDAEMAIMRTHPDVGYRILSGNQGMFIQLAAEIALTHHEKFDGSGYPSGLRGEAIPLAARIVAVADVFDALTSSRPYKIGWEFDHAVKFMIANANTHFDPACIDAFLAVLPEIKKIQIDFHGVSSMAAL